LKQYRFQAVGKKAWRRRRIQQRRIDTGDSRYAEAISKLEKELAEKGLSRDEIKSLEEVIYGQADEILEGAAAGTGGAVTGRTADAGSRLAVILISWTHSPEKR